MNNKRNIKKRKILKIIRKLSGDRLLNYFLSYRSLGALPNLKNPKTFNEKIQWIKLYGNIEELGTFVDKYAVRKYIADTIGTEFLIPLLRVFKDETEIDFNDLPKSFIMKATHTSGYNYVVKDSSKEDFEELKKIAKSWLDTNYYEETGERNYKKINPGVVIEEIIGNGDSLTEYKIHCFNGIPKIIQVNGNENGARKGNYYTIDWNLLPFYKGSRNFDQELKKPNKLEELIEVSKELSSHFNYVRVDLYLYNNQIYFGELTFTPSGGLAKFSDENYDYKMGSMLKLSEDILIN